MTDPLRILDDMSEPAELQELMQSGLAVGPGEAELASLAAKLGLPILPGGDGPAPAPSTPQDVPQGAPGGAAPSLLRSPWIGRALIGGAGAVLVGLLAIPRQGPPAERFFDGISFPLAAPESSESSGSSAVSEAPAVSASAVPSPPAVVSRAALHAPAAAVSASAKEVPPAPTADAVSESAMLLRARRLLASDPAAALAITQEHRRRFRNGALVQEREVIAIDALARLGKKREAADRAKKFDSEHPDSPHRDKIGSAVQ